MGSPSLPHPLQPDSSDLIKTGNISPEFDDAFFNSMLLWKNERGGVLEPNSFSNILAFLRHHPKYLGMFRYDRFAGRVVVHKCPPWEGREKFRVRKLTDNDTIYVTSMLECEKGKLCPTSTRVQECIYVVAHENWIDPPLEYFESLKWDGTQRLNRVLQTYFGAKGNDEYLSTIGECFFIAGVARQYRPGCRAENILVLEGPQGELKSTALAALATIGTIGDEESYFCDTLTFSDIQQKDTVLKLKGKLVVEFPELAKLDHKGVEEIKQWMSIRFDEIRKPYGRETESFPRRFIMAGSTNETFYLKDKTGNRRYWPVKVGLIDIFLLIQDLPQLWAEAVHLFKSGKIWWIPKNSPVLKIAEFEQSIRVPDDIWISPIERYLDGINMITVDEILEKIGIEVSKREDRHVHRIGTILKKIGFEPKTKWDPKIKKNRHQWIRKDIQPQILVPKEADYEEIKF